jgi:hypothetical protein
VAASLEIDYPVFNANAFAAAEAKRRGFTLVTGDPELFPLQGATKRKNFLFTAPKIVV